MRDGHSERAYALTHLGALVDVESARFISDEVVSVLTTLVCHHWAGWIGGWGAGGVLWLGLIDPAIATKALALRRRDMGLCTCMDLAALMPMGDLAGRQGLAWVRPTIGSVLFWTKVAGFEN